VQSQKCLALLWNTVKQQFDFRVAFLSIHRDEQCGYPPGRLAPDPDIVEREERSLSSV
jgi:hypothetical protein